MRTRTLLTTAAATLVALGTIGSVALAAGGGADDAPSAIHAIDEVASGARTTSTSPAHDSASDRADDTAIDDTTIGDTTVDEGATGPDAGPGVGPAGSDDEVLPGSGQQPPTGPTDLLGELDDDDPVPGPLDLVADIPAPQPKPNPGIGKGPGSLQAAPSCAHQCIAVGTAHPRGFGALLHLETTVPVEFFVSVIADDDESDYHVDTTLGGLTAHDWAIDHLRPGTLYHAMAAATDAQGHTSYVWGSFTTLSTRTVDIQIGSIPITGGPGGIEDTTNYLRFEGDLQDVTWDQQPDLHHVGVDRYAAIEFWISRYWGGKVCEGWSIYDGLPANGHDAASCLAWNSVSASGIDLDTIPQGKDRWTQTSVSMVLDTQAPNGNALPPGYGDPFWFAFKVPITLHVTYS